MASLYSLNKDELILLISKIQQDLLEENTELKNENKVFRKFLIVKKIYCSEPGCKEFCLVNKKQGNISVQYTTNEKFAYCRFCSHPKELSEYPDKNKKDIMYCPSHRGKYVDFYEMKHDYSCNGELYIHRAFYCLECINKEKTTSYLISCEKISQN